MTEPLHYELRPSAFAEPAGALVLCHGRGVDEHDLLPLLDVLDPKGRLAGATPRAPLQLPPGGQHWYRILRVGFPDPDTFWASFELLGEFLDALAQRTGVPISDTVLGGFSQGAVMASALALGKGRPVPAGLLMMSGFIPTVTGFEPELGSRRDMPVAISHGSADPVISVEFARHARSLLEEEGMRVLYRESAMAHTIDPRTLPDLTDFVADATPR